MTRSDRGPRGAEGFWADGTRPARESGRVPVVIRYLLVTAAVGASIALGFLLRLRGNAYLLIGMPITVLFQLFVARRPLRELWLRDGQPIIVDWRTLLLAAFFLIGPIQTIVLGSRLRDWSVIVYGIVAVVGAGGAAVAFRVLPRAGLRQLGVLFLVSIPIALARVLIDLAAGGHDPSNLLIGRRLWVDVRSLLFYLPAVFVAEEVFFRGALDSYLHRGDTGRGWFSAAFVSLLWGFWHTPVYHPLTPTLIASLLGVQLFLGLILSWLWRRSGNLAMNGSVHALVDAVRNTLLS